LDSRCLCAAQEGLGSRGGGRATPITGRCGFLSQQPYQDVELCARTGHASPVLVRAVAADVACCSTTDVAVVDDVKCTAEDMVSTLTPLAHPDSVVRCLFRLTEHGIRIRVRISADTLLEEVGSNGVQSLPEMVPDASTIAVPDDDGETAVICDALVPLPGR
jgi:hypothetical protein